MVLSLCCISSLNTWRRLSGSFVRENRDSRVSYPSKCDINKCKSRCMLLRGQSPQENTPGLSATWPRLLCYESQTRLHGQNLFASFSYSLPWALGVFPSSIPHEWLFWCTLACMFPGHVSALQSCGPVCHAPTLPPAGPFTILLLSPSHHGTPLPILPLPPGRCTQ